MVTYHEWNQALATYFTQDVPRGSAIYLDVSREALHEIWSNILNQSGKRDPVTSFCQAVRGYILEYGSVLNLKHALRQSIGSADAPLGLAWLCLQVLAAVQMRPDENHNLSNYYVHLRALLNLPGTGKPKGLDYIDLERLWLQWNRWLSAQGFQSTAQRGSTKTTKYIHYPLSQCLLRQGEAGQLEQLWFENNLPTTLNRMQLRQWFESLKQYKVNDRLFKLLRQGQRPEIYQAIYQLYLSGDWQHATQAISRKRAQVVEAGLYRHENFITDEVRYYAHPQQRGFWSHTTTAGQIQWAQGEPQQLTLQRPGWFSPLRHALSDLEQRRVWEVSQGSITQVIFPGAKVWALVPDPDNPEAGFFATWQRPQGDVPFLLLAKADTKDQVEAAKAMGIINSRKVLKAEGLNGWWEYVDCTLNPTSAEQWALLKQRAPEVWSCLVPHTTHRLLCRGGLSGFSEGRRGWLKDYPPQIALSSDLQDVHLELLAPDEQLHWQGPLEDFHASHWPGAGSYLLRATLPEGQYCEKVVHLWDWKDLSLPLSIEGFKYEMETGATMQGGILSE